MQKFAKASSNIMAIKMFSKDRENPSLLGLSLFPVSAQDWVELLCKTEVIGAGSAWKKSRKSDSVAIGRCGFGGRQVSRGYGYVM